MGTYRSRVTDVLTGEIIEDRVHTFNKDKPRQWVRLYLDAWVTIQGMTGITRQTLDVLYLMLRLLPAAYVEDKDLPVVTPSVYHKDKWAEELGTTRAVINKHILKLEKEGVISRVVRDGKQVRGSYVVNPQLIGYGENVHIDNLTKIYGTFSIDENGAKVEPVFVSSEKED